MSIQGSESFNSETSIKYELNGSIGIARVADDEFTVEYDRNVTYYDGVNNGTLNISSSNNAVVNLSDGRYNHISNVDASSASGHANISGDSLNNTLRGGTNYSTLWGGGGDDLLIGGAGKDTFRYTMNDGNDTITSSGLNDVVDLEFSFNNVSSYEFNDAGIKITIGENSLNIIGTSMTEFNFSDRTYNINYSEKTIT